MVDEDKKKFGQAMFSSERPGHLGNMKGKSFFSSKIIAWKYISVKRKFGFQLLSANLVFAFIGVRQLKFMAVPARKAWKERLDLTEGKADLPF